jgi:hypothetical protein
MALAALMVVQTSVTLWSLGQAIVNEPGRKCRARGRTVEC